MWQCCCQKNIRGERKKKENDSNTSTRRKGQGPLPFQRLCPRKRGKLTFMCREKRGTISRPAAAQPWGRRIRMNRGGGREGFSDQESSLSQSASADGSLKGKIRAFIVHHLMRIRIHLFPEVPTRQGSPREGEKKGGRRLNPALSSQYKERGKQRCRSTVLLIRRLMRRKKLEKGKGGVHNHFSPQWEEEEEASRTFSRNLYCTRVRGGKKKDLKIRPPAGREREERRLIPF